MHDAEFASKLRKTMAEEGMSLYGLALRYAAKAEPPILRESAERSLYKWLDPNDPTRPSRASRRALALALGKPPDFFGRGRQDEMQRLLRQMNALVDCNRELERVA